MIQRGKEVLRIKLFIDLHCHKEGKENPGTLTPTGMVIRAHSVNGSGQPTRLSLGSFWTWSTCDYPEGRKLFICLQNDCVTFNEYLHIRYIKWALYLIMFGQQILLLPSCRKLEDIRRDLSYSKDYSNVRVVYCSQGPLRK